MKYVVMMILFYSAFSHSAGACKDIKNSNQVGLCSESKMKEADSYLNEQYSVLLRKVNS